MRPTRAVTSLQPITGQVQTAAEASKPCILLEKTAERLLPLSVVLRRRSQSISENVIQEQNELAAASRGKPAITS